MAITPYSDLTTQGILSSHISGLSHSVNKIERILNMKTKSATFDLFPITNQQEVSLRYRIYEGEIRNWTSFELKRNNVIVPSDEYEAQPSFGVVVFNSPQSQNDRITVSATYIDSESEKINKIESDISNIVGNQINPTEFQNLKTDMANAKSNISINSEDITTLEQDIETLNTRIDNLPTGGGSTGSINKEFETPLTPGPNLFLNIIPGKTISDLSISTDLLMAAGKIDAMPIIVEKRTKISRLSIDGAIGTSSGEMILGIYSNADIEPAQLISETEPFSISAGEIIKPLKSPAYLDVGIYWLARWASTGISLDGHSWDNTVHIPIAPMPSSWMDGSGDIVGVRSGVISGLTSLPEIFPPCSTTAGESKYLAREDLGTVYALR